MSSLNIQERFTLDAEPEAVWQALIDPEQVVSCLPGAELTGVNDDGSYKGAVKVKVGAVTIAYRGTAIFEETDHDRRFVRIVGRGREKSGSGTVSMTMESRVASAPGGGADVTVEAEVKLTGKIVRFGRGMIQTVSAELFNDFTRRLQRRLTAQAPSGDGVDAGADTSSEATLSNATTGASEEEDDTLALLPLLWRSFKRWLRSLFR